MIKRIALILLAFVLTGVFCACTSGNTGSTTQLQVSTTAPVTTTAPQNPTTTEPTVSMPDDNTAWANYIVDEDYNYIADRLTDAQKSDVEKMCKAVKCKVEFGEDYTKITDANKNEFYYSKTFGEDTIIIEPDFGVLTLARRAGNETVFVYKGATFLDFVTYIEQVELSGFYHSSVSSADYMSGEGIFVGSDTDGNSVIIKITGEMVIISLAESASES